MTLKAVTPPPTPTPLEELLEIMARLRHPISGSEWERSQTFQSIAPNAIEEAHELVEALEQGDIAEIKSELGDVLLQVVFHSQMAKEQGHFTFQSVAEGLNNKIKARLPHMFGRQGGTTMQEQLEEWERVKDVDRAQKGYTSIFDGLTPALPALVRANKLQSRAARAGFDWSEAHHITDKLHEELAEVNEAIAEGDKAHIQEEIGDLLFITAKLARFYGVDAEAALRGTNRKYENRVRYIEQQLKAQGKTLKDSTLDEMMALWLEAKHVEKQQVKDDAS